MDLRHFFENMVRREETASAFLATLLDSDPAFRQEFLRLVLGEPRFEDGESWLVQVESGRVDVTLESADCLVIIENKISAGAKQRDQLLRYYVAAVAASPAKRIVAVYLAPGGMGLGEVQAVERSPVRLERPRDVVSQVPWEKVADVIARLQPSDRAWFAQSGIRQIGLAIERARHETFPPEGDRGLIRAIAGDAVQQLRARFPDLQFGLWSNRDSEEIFTFKTGVTMSLMAVYEVDAEPPFSPVGVRTDDGVRFDLLSRFKLAGKVKHTSPLGHEWGQLLEVGALDVPGIGRHDLHSDKWFVHLGRFTASSGAASASIAEAGYHLLGALGPFLSTDSEAP